MNSKQIYRSDNTVYPILFIIGACHLLNDSLQAVIPAMFPILENSLGLTFTQLGLIAFTLNMVASVMQPVIGMYTDKRPMPFALPIGLTSSMLGMLGLAFAPNFWMILISVIFIGLGSATFHPEGSRVAYLAAGNRRGLSQSIFQVGGNTGQSLAPLITALILVPLGQFGAIWFTLVAGIAVLLLIYIAKWYQSAISNFYAFYAIEQFEISIAKAQIYIFSFLFMGAVGTFLGGPFADRFGKRNVIIISFLMPIPLAIGLQFANAVISIVLLLLIGLFIMSSFSVTVVYAQELMPGKVGTMSGLIVGLAFGLGAIGSVAFGTLIDWIGFPPTMIIVSILPLIGVLSFLLPSDESIAKWYA